MEHALRQAQLWHDIEPRQLDTDASSLSGGQFLDNRKSLLVFAEKCMTGSLYQDQETKQFHACPKTQRIAESGPDRDRWMESMQEELDTIEKMGVWTEEEYTPAGCKPLPCKFIYKPKMNSSGFTVLEVYNCILGDCRVR